MVSQPVSPVSPVGSRRSWASSLRHEPTNQHNDHAARTGDAPPIPPQETLTPDPQSHAAASPRPPSHETSPHPVDADFPVRSSASSAQYHPQDAERLKLWTPFFLRRRVLLSFITLFILLIIVLAILFGLSSRDERLASADSQLYYLWVYGPTAVFTTIAAFWAQIEYRSKQMTPWVLMAQEPQSVQKSLLLDYIDPMNIVSLYTSFRNHHWVIMSALAGTFLIQLITVLSSGLFVSSETTMRNVGAHMAAWDAFSGSVPATAGAEPATNVYGILASNLSYPNGTLGQYSYQWFNSSDENTFNMTALVDVFSADLSCELGTIKSVSISQSLGNSTNTLEETQPRQPQTEYEQADLQLESSSCSDLYISVRQGNSFGYNGSFCSNLNAQEEDTGRFVLLWGDWTDGGSSPSKRAPQDIQLDDSWTTLRDATSTANQNTGVGIQTIEVASSADPPSLTRSSATTVSATVESQQTSGPTVISLDDGNLNPSSSPQTATTTTSASGLSPTAGVPFTIGSLTLQVAAPTFSPSLGLVCSPSYSIRKGSVALSKDANGDITPSISFTGNETSTILPIVTSWNILQAFAQTITQTERSISSLNMEALINATIPQANFTADANTTQAAVTRLFRLVSAQFSNIYLKESATTSITGTTVSREQRLLVHTLSFWLSESLLLLLTLTALFLFFKSPAIATPRDPSTMAGLATILSRSGTVMSQLEGTGISSLKHLEQHLSQEQFATSAGVSAHSSHPTFRIESTRADEHTVSADSSPESEDIQTVAWYQPFAVTITGRALILSAPLGLILALELLYQYSARNDGLVAVDDANLFVHYAWTYIPTAVMIGIGQMFAMLDTTAKIFNPYHNLRKGNAPPDKSIMENYQRSVTAAALCRAVRKLQYTVVAAGLAAVLTPFLTIVVSGLFNAESAPTTYTASFARIDTFDPNMTSTGAGLAYANLVLANNLSDPLWTHQDLAFPGCSQHADSITDTDGESVSNVNASRVALSLPAVRGNFNCTPATHAQIYCNDLAEFFLAQPNASYGDGRQNQYFSGTGHFGSMFALDPSLYPGCPAVMVAFGHVDNNTIDEVTHLACAPYVESVQANATFKLPGWELDESESVETANETGVFYDKDLPDFVQSLSYSFANPLAQNRSDEDLASIFPLVVHGRNGTPIAEMMGQENIENLKRAVETTYALIMAQVLNQDRQDGGDNNEVFKGVLTDENGLRLKQSPISTRILEGLLAAMFVCAALTFALLDTRRVLPKNPCSIGAVASLLAGSSLLASIPEGAEWMSDKQLRQKGVFEGMTFSLGWWGGDEGSGSDGDGRSTSIGTGRRFGIDVGSAMDEKGGANESADANEEKKDWRPKWWKRIWP